MQFMPYGVDFGFLKEAKMEEKTGVLTGKGKAIRVLPQKEELDDKLIRYFTDHAIEINTNK